MTSYEHWLALLERAVSEGEADRRMAVIDASSCLAVFLEAQGIEIGGHLPDALERAAEMGLIDDERCGAACRAVRRRNDIAHKMLLVSAEDAVEYVTAMAAVCVTPDVTQTREEEEEESHDERGSSLAGRIFKGLAIGAAALAVIGLVTSVTEEAEREKKRGGNTDR